jgi:hypothetical protein
MTEENTTSEGFKRFELTGKNAIIREGYRLVYLSEHPRSDTKGYVKEHRIIMEQMIGRYLLPKRRCSSYQWYESRQSS